MEHLKYSCNYDKYLQINKISALNNPNQPNTHCSAIMPNILFVVKSLHM